MKIQQLLEYPAAIGGPLAAAKAREAGSALTNFGSVGAKRAAGQGKMAAAPAANLKVVPGGKSVAPTTTPAATGTTAAPTVKYNVPTAAVPQTKSNLPQPTAKPAAATPAQAKQPGVMDKFKNWATSPQSGKDITKFASGMADAGGALSRGTQTVAKGTGKLVKGVGQGVADVGHGVGTALGGVGSVAKGLGDVAAQTAGGITQTVGSALGGFKHGYQTAAGGQKFGGGGYSGTPTGTPAQPATTGGSSAGGRDEVADLKSALQAMDARLKKAGI